VLNVIPIGNDFITSNEEVVYFTNFAVDHPELQPEHDHYIEKIVVEHFIDLLEAGGFFRQAWHVLALIRLQ
jgi:hypothetical protein